MINIKILPLLLFFALSAVVYSQEVKLDPDSVRITYNYINTNPQSAEVLVNDTLAGATPYRSYIPFKKGDLIRLRYPGFLEERINITEDDEFIYRHIDLISLKTIVSRPRPSFVLDDTPVFFPKKRKYLPIAISSILAVTGGILAYKFKQDANEKYDDYLLTGDKGLLEHSEKLDTYSGVSLGISIVSLGTAVYYLFFY
jgi:hypothetical protein